MIRQRKSPNPALTRPTLRTSRRWTTRHSLTRIGLLVGPDSDRTCHASCPRCRLDGNCRECDLLWAEFSQANQRLLTAVETKYEQVRFDALVEAQVLVAIDDRQRAKQRILAHQLWAHAE